MDRRKPLRVSFDLPEKAKPAVYNQSPAAVADRNRKLVLPPGTSSTSQQASIIGPVAPASRFLKPKFSNLKNKVLGSLPSSKVVAAEEPKVAAMRAIINLSNEKEALQEHNAESREIYQELISTGSFVNSNKAKRLKKKMERNLTKMKRIDRRIGEERVKLRKAARADVMRRIGDNFIQPIRGVT